MWEELDSKVNAASVESKNTRVTTVGKEARTRTKYPKIGNPKKVKKEEAIALDP